MNFGFKLVEKKVPSIGICHNRNSRKIKQKYHKSVRTPFQSNENTVGNKSIFLLIQQETPRFLDTSFQVSSSEISEFLFLENKEEKSVSNSIASEIALKFWIFEGVSVGMLIVSDPLAKKKKGRRKNRREKKSKTKVVKHLGEALGGVLRSSDKY